MPVFTEEELEALGLTEEEKEFIQDESAWISASSEEEVKIQEIIEDDSHYGSDWYDHSESETRERHARESGKSISVPVADFSPETRFYKMLAEAPNFQPSKTIQTQPDSLKEMFNDFEGQLEERFSTVSDTLYVSDFIQDVDIEPNAFIILGLLFYDGDVVSSEDLRNKARLSRVNFRSAIKILQERKHIVTIKKKGKLFFKFQRL